MHAKTQTYLGSTSSHILDSKTKS